jgi:glycosyltransferase involved in cell wall biosynthesis
MDLEVSVVVTTFRRERQVLESIASAQAQTGVRHEIIVVDDSPEGSARQAVEPLAASGVRYFHRKSPSGGVLGLPRNEGIRLTSAPFFIVLDDDDRLCEGALSALANALESSRAGIAFGRAAPFGFEPDLTKEKKYWAKVARVAQRVRGRRWLTAHLLFLDNPLMNGLCMYRRDAFEEEGGYDESLRTCEDIELLVRIIRTRGAAFVDQDVLHYCVGAPSIMKKLREKGYDPDMDHTYKTIHKRYRERFGALEYRSLQVLAKTARRLALA